jgi:tetratricopeptide (TPR) repeat protein
LFSNDYQWGPGIFLEEDLDREQVEAESKEQVLKSLDRAASGLREKLGESIGSVQKFATPLEAATTSSLEALQAYSLGYDEHQKTNDDAAVPHLLRAVQIDPNFAMAYATMGVAYNNSRRPTEGIAALKKAYELRDRASEREKFYIQAHYFDEVILNPEKTLAVYAEWRETYPRDAVPLDNTALLYSSIGQHDKAMDFASQATRLDPNDRYAGANLAFAYLGLNRFDEAKSVGDRAVAQKLDGAVIHVLLSDLAFVRGDWAAWDRELDFAKGKPEETFMLFWRAGGQASLGKVKSARRTLALARSELLPAGERDYAGLLFEVEALDDALAGDTAEAHQKAQEGLALSSEADVRATAAAALAVSGDAAKSTEVLNAVKREFPDNFYLQEVNVPRIQAIAALQKNKPEEAIASLEALRPYELGTGVHGLAFDANYLRGLAYLKLPDGVKAAAEFQRILDHQGVGASDPEYALARVGLARAYALQGDKAKARTAYQDFFAAWKDADPDVPILLQARAEYDKLK